ncbi:MAG: hypothetical protein M3O91_09050 [Chloroflexota bacterium]|nr:hypothetical protein [Chloroflexota bacterium]
MVHHREDVEDGSNIHLPPPSFAPATIGLGTTLLAFGILYGVPFLVLGGLLFVLGLGGWLMADARQMASADEAGHGGHAEGH